jgi:hypothetical protein
MFVFQTSRANGPGRESSGRRYHQYIHNRCNIQSCEVKVSVYRDVPIDATDSFRLIEDCYYHPSAWMCLVQSKRSAGSRHTAAPRLRKPVLTVLPIRAQTIGKRSENFKALGDVDCRKRVVGNEIRIRSNVSRTGPWWRVHFRTRKKQLLLSFYHMVCLRDTSEWGRSP